MVDVYDVHRRCIRCGMPCYDEISQDGMVRQEPRKRRKIGFLSHQGLSSISSLHQCLLLVQPHQGILLISLTKAPSSISPFTTPLAHQAPLHMYNYTRVAKASPPYHHTRVSCSYNYSRVPSSYLIYHTIINYHTITNYHTIIYHTITAGYPPYT